jgi:hypothetical protein
MTFEQVANIFVGICAVLGVIGNIISFLLIRPLLAEREANAKLKERIDNLVFDATQSRFTGHGRMLDDHEARIGELEVLNAGVQGAALRVFITREDFERAEKVSSHSRELMNEKLDAALQNDSAQNEALDTIKKQISEIFRMFKTGNHR